MPSHLVSFFRGLLQIIPKIHNIAGYKLQIQKMTLKSTLLPVLVFLNAVAFATAPTIHPVVSPTAICQGDTVTVAILTSDTFATGTVFYVQLSDSSGSFNQPAAVDSVIGQGNDTISFVMGALGKNSSHYKIRVRASNGIIGLDSTALTVHKTPVVNFQLPHPSYCTYAYTVPLTGGTPAGGVYSGNFVVNSAFQAYVSDTGTFEVYYTYTDTIGCFAEDSTSIGIISCPAPSVSVQVNPSSICSGSNISVIIQTSDVIGSDNVFTIQLSDSSGSFTSPTVLATDSNSSSNTIVIPAPTEPAGNHYKIRVIASDPSTISVPYNVSFRTQLTPPVIRLDTSGRLSICTRDSIKLQVDSLHGILYQWTFNGNPIVVPKYTYEAKDSGLYEIMFTDTTVAGCSSGIDSVFIGVYAHIAKPVISPTGTIKLCGTGTVALSTPSINGVTYQWDNHGQNISGATQNSYSASSTGVYLVVASAPGMCATKSDSVHVNIHINPVVSFTLPFDSFCVHAASIALTGGSPSGSGGAYSGNFVVNNATFDQTESGVGNFEIYYTFVDSIGCSATDSANIHIYNCTTSGIHELSNENAFEMFPNPASNKVNISVNGGANCKMGLFDLLGQQIGSQVFNQQLTYSVENLPAGVYLVEISDISDSWKTVKRLVVQ
jgi:hypothetical protein